MKGFHCLLDLISRVFALYYKSQKRSTSSLELVLQMAVSHQVGARNQTWVLYAYQIYFPFIIWNTVTLHPCVLLDVAHMWELAHWVLLFPSLTYYVFPLQSLLSLIYWLDNVINLGLLYDCIWEPLQLGRKCPSCEVLRFEVHLLVKLVLTS